MSFCLFRRHGRSTGFALPRRRLLQRLLQYTQPADARDGCLYYNDRAAFHITINLRDSLSSLAFCIKRILNEHNNTARRRQTRQVFISFPVAFVQHPTGRSRFHRFIDLYCIEGIFLGWLYHFGVFACALLSSMLVCIIIMWKLTYRDVSTVRSR